MTEFNDVLLSIDLVRKANEVKNFILVACDTDFVPAIKDIREKDNIRVILYYFNRNFALRILILVFQKKNKYYKCYYSIYTTWFSLL